MRALLHDADGRSLHTGDERLVGRWLATPGAHLWLDLGEADTGNVSTLLTDQLHLHPLAVQDALRSRHPPKYERFDAHLLLILRGLDADTDSVDFGVVQIAMFVSERLLVTRSSGRSVNTDQLWDEAQAQPSRLTELPALALELTRRVVRRYLPILQALDPRIEEIEAELHDRPSDTLLAELSHLKSRLTRLRRIFRYHERALREFQSQDAAGYFSVDYTHHAADLVDQVERCRSLGELHYALVDDLQNGYIAVASHNLNQVMRVLTVSTVVFVPLSFLVGLYGMNFEYIPELKAPYGYFILLGVMGTIAGVLLWLFRRRGWL